MRWSVTGSASRRTHGSPHSEKSPTRPIIAEYLSFSFNFFGHWDFFNNAYWSLPVEFQFYLLFPIFVLLLRIGPFALAAGALFLFVVSSLLHLHFLTFMLAWQFAVGIGAGWLLLRRRLQLPSHTLLLGCAVLLAVAVGVSFFHKRLYYPPGVSDWTYLGLLAFPIVYLAAQISRPAGRFGRTLFRFAVSEGEASVQRLSLPQRLRSPRLRADRPPATDRPDARSRRVYSGIRRHVRGQPSLLPVYRAAWNRARAATFHGYRKPSGPGLKEAGSCLPGTGAAGLPASPPTPISAGSVRRSHARHGGANR